LLGFRASVPLEQGLADLVKWWRAERGSLVAARRQEAAAS
jgi:UDP-glucose 4-epimerase